MADSHKSVTLPEKLSTVSTVKGSGGSGWNPSLPNGWARRGAAGDGGMRFIVSAQDGRTVGEASLSSIGASVSVEPAVTARTRRKTLGGVPFTQLRRTVIDKMVSANGWVVNDLQREIGGRTVFIVLARTAASGDGRTPEQSWVFYFTEVDGRIYSLATSSLLEYADRIADESSQLVASFHANRSTPAEASIR